MSSNMDLYKAFYEASWANPPSSLRDANMKYLSDDFQNFDADGKVIGDKEAYIGLSQLIFAAFPDFKSVDTDLREEGDDIIVSYQWEGTQTGDLDLSAMSLGVIPASGKRIVWPEATSVFTIKGGKIVSIKPYGDSSGMEEFLKPLGIAMPSA
ncbi:MAG: ester cyclase [Anaerolineales bacterium]